MLALFQDPNPSLFTFATLAYLWLGYRNDLFGPHPPPGLEKPLSPIPNPSFHHLASFSQLELPCIDRAFFFFERLPATASNCLQQQIFH